MKKIYVTPIVTFETVEETADILAGSGFATYQIDGDGDNLNGPIDAVDGDESDAKGSFAFYDSWEEEMW